MISSAGFRLRKSPSGTAFGGLERARATPLATSSPNTMHAKRRFTFTLLLAFLAIRLASPVLGRSHPADRKRTRRSARRVTGGQCATYSLYFAPRKYTRP